MEFSKLLPALENGKVDMVLSGMTITPARNLKVAFVGPYYISGKAFLTKIETIAKAKDATEVNSPNVRLTALRGSTSQYFVEQVLPKVQLVPAKDYDEAVKLVIQGKVNAMIADYPICVVSVYRYPNKGLLSVITPLTYEPLGIAVPSYDPHLVNWLENFLSSLEETGGMDELKARWFGDASWLLVRRRFLVEQTTLEGHNFGFRIADCRLRRGAGHKAQGAGCHMAAPSLGHYASLSFVVIGRGKRAEFRIFKMRNP
jgi:polar amino acid transport system substrate-binding protein